MEHQRALSRGANPVRRALTAAAVLAVTAPLAACVGVLDPVGPIGAGNKTILIDALIIMLAIAVPTILLAFWIGWKYRASNTKAEYLPEWAYSGRIEAVVWSIPILVIMFLSGVIWIGSYRLDPFRPIPSKTPPVEVQVVSLDWKWLFIYPHEGIATVNQLVLPVGTPVHFRLTSASVFNTFFIPRLGSMIYTMPGMVSQLWLRADKPSELMGISGHFSGDGFSDMNFTVKNVPADAYAAWTASVKGQGAKLDRNAYAVLSQQSQADRPMAFGAVDPNLFQDIATQALPPGPGPNPPTPAHAGRETSTGGSQ
jgi:cytochrome o ubiquinol oxidase subunit 2